MNMLCQFGPITVLFQEMPTSPLWPFWRWKLDPFRIANDAPDVVVNYSDQPIQPEGTAAWEDFGVQVCRQVYILADGRVLWQQTEHTTGALQLQFAVSADWTEITLTADHSPLPAWALLKP